MAYITRDDGQHFVVPSYRDALNAHRKDLLKKEITLLSQSYGDYITLQKKDVDHVEVAFSPDTGYLLGESIWQYFKRPEDLVYCEAIPNTNEALLVIVKAGSVYLDGTFPIDSIPEELVIFKTQTNHFEIYVYGDVPIAKEATPESNKFVFDASSVKSFTVLDQPVFATLPLYKQFQLQLVDAVLKANRIGVFPIGKVIAGIGVVAFAWFLFSMMTKQKAVPVIVAAPVNPYLVYVRTLTSPPPNQEVDEVLNKITLLFTLPGWIPNTIEYAQKILQVTVTSPGSKVVNLLDWAKNHDAKVDIKPNAIYLSMPIDLANRNPPTDVYPLQQVMALLIDKMATVMPGNHLLFGAYTQQGVVLTAPVTVSFDQVTPTVLALIGEQFKGLPLVLQKASFTASNGFLSGTIILQALGS